MGREVCGRGFIGVIQIARKKKKQFHPSGEIYHTIFVAYLYAKVQKK